MTRPRRPRRAAFAALVTGLALGHLNGGCIEQSEVQCEEAVAHLDACCPGVDPAAFDCTHYADSGCGELNPDLDVDTSRAIRASSCDGLVAGGTCAWAVSHQPGQALGAPEGPP